MFARGSRYEKVADLSLTDRTGRVIAYKAIRYIPAAPAIGSHAVSQGERLDHLAYRYLRDPGQFWRICDANAAMLPGDLVSETGRRILIPPAQR